MLFDKSGYGYIDKLVDNAGAKHKIQDNLILSLSTYPFIINMIYIMYLDKKLYLELVPNQF